MKLAVTGKGGVGKTTASALLALGLARGGRSVFAIDADPDTNLAAALGFPDPDTITPIVEMKELIAERMGTRPGAVGAYFKLNPTVEDIPGRFRVEHSGIKLMVMGMVKRGGAGCACPENAFLKVLLTQVILDSDDVILVDMEAGLEHLGRGTTGNMDGLLTVVEPSLRSLETFGRVRKLAADIGVRRVWPVANRIASDEERAFVVEHLDGTGLLGCIPYSETIVKANRGQASLDEVEPEVKEEVDGIIERIYALTRS